MNNQQYLLEKLGEECLEVAMIASKAKQFGFNSDNNGQLEKTNKEYLHDELNDVTAQIELLNEECGLDYTPDRAAIEAKKEKMRKYRKISIELGFVSKQ